MEARRARWLPRDRAMVGPRPLRAIEVDPQHIAGGCPPRVPGGVGDAHAAVPDLGCLIDARRHLKTRVPLPAVFMTRRIEIDIEIDPFAARRNLEFLVPANVLKIGEA